MPDLFSSLEYNIRMGSGHSGLATVQSAKEPVVASTKIVDAQGRVKVKRKIVKKKLVDNKKQDQVKIETSTTTSTSAVYGKSMGKNRARANRKYLKLSLHLPILIQSTSNKKSIKNIEIEEELLFS